MGPGTCISIPADMQHVDSVKRLVEEISRNEKGNNSDLLLLFIRSLMYLDSFAYSCQQRWGGVG